tara:strand:- start:143 stop:781 length:639 start_codon:yes stop_codon:yes gene_type:complete
MFNIEKYQEILKKIEKAGKKTKIIAISKNHSKQAVEKAISYGVNIFGENRVQEARLKFEDLIIHNKSIQLHLTGPLQTNKVKQALSLFDVFHTLDREKLLTELSKHPEKIKNKSFFIQVNTGKELSKSGVYPENVKSFLKQCNLRGLNNVLGLMCIPPINESPTKHFQIISNLTKEIGKSEISIGMSSDYIEALSFNPTYIRLGSVLFGKRL